MKGKLSSRRIELVRRVVRLHKSLHRGMHHALRLVCCSSTYRFIVNSKLPRLSVPRFIYGPACSFIVRALSSSPARCPTLRTAPQTARPTLAPRCSSVPPYRTLSLHPAKPTPTCLTIRMQPPHSSPAPLNPRRLFHSISIDPTAVSSN